MNLLLCVPVVVVSVLAAGRGGWLDRHVKITKENFIRDVQETLDKVDLKATLQKTPPGYKDSELWDLPSVLRLIDLLEKSPDPPIRRMMEVIQRPSRRMSVGESYKRFPSLAKTKLINEFYYDFDSSMEVLSQSSDDDQPGTNAIIEVSNPVESRLPSSHISVRLLKQVLTYRAMAARMLPTTTQPPFSWITKVTSKTTSQPGATEHNITTETTTTTGQTTADPAAASTTTTSDPAAPTTTPKKKVTTTANLTITTNSTKPTNSTT